MENDANARLPANGAQAERLHRFSHDIKNRLTGIQEVVRQLQGEAPGPSEREELLAYAERAFFGAQRDIEDLLDDLHVDRGITIAEPAPFDLTAALTGAIRNEAYRLGKKDQHLHPPPEGAVMAYGDERWTTSILQALISNASKFSPPGSTIAVGIDERSGECSVHVSDTGCGLSKEDLDRVFTRYAILSSRTTNGEPQARGTLARARQWALAQGGSLSVTSDGTGQGCTFTLTLRTA